MSEFSESVDQDYNPYSEPPTASSTPYPTTMASTNAMAEIQTPQSRGELNRGSSGPKRNFGGKGSQVPIRRRDELPASPQETSQSEPLASEVAELRRQIEQMRMEQQANPFHPSTTESERGFPPPPSYEDREL